MDVGTVGEREEISTTVSSVTQQPTQPTEVTSAVVRPEHADADMTTMKVEVETAVTSYVEAPVPVAAKPTAMEVVSTGARGPEQVERGIGEPGEEMSTTVSSVTKEEVHPAEVISSDLGPRRTDSGVTAPTKEVVSTVTSVSKEPTPKVVTQTMGVMTEPAPVGVHRGTETVQVEEPMPIIQKESAVTVRAAPPPPADIQPPVVKFITCETPTHSRALFIHEHIPDAKSVNIGKASVVLSQPTHTGSFELLSPSVVHITSQTEDLPALTVQNRAAATGDTIESPPHSPKLKSKTGYVQVQSSGSMYAKPKLEDKQCNTDSILQSEKSVQISPDTTFIYSTHEETKVSKPTATVSIQTGDMEERMITTGEYNEASKISKVDFGELAQPLSTTTATMTEVMIEPAKPVLVHSVPPVQPVSSAKEELTSGWVPQIKDKGIVAPMQEIVCAVTSLIQMSTPMIAEAKPLTVASINVKSPRYTDTGKGEPAKELSTTVTSKTAEDITKDVVTTSKPEEIKTDAEVEVLKDAKSIAVTSTRKQEKQKITLNISRTETVRRENGVNRGTETMAVEEPMPIIQKESTVAVHAAPPLEATPAPVQLRYGMIQTAVQQHYEGTTTGEVHLSEMEYATASVDLIPKIEPTAVVEAPTLKVGRIQSVYESAVANAITSYEEVKHPLTTMQIHTKEKEGQYEATTEVMDKPIVSVITSIQVPKPNVSSTATMTEVMIEPAQPVVVH
ncbi:unnamed protein product, partial [Taenia asiatica]|uniref:4_1_CTD domain-containing protein n=1 Tax=Taenia asiatica TaxID=60517 RepID=A0A0R3VZA1_TAEAS